MSTGENPIQRRYFSSNVSVQCAGQRVEQLVKKADAVVLDYTEKISSDMEDLYGGDLKLVSVSYKGALKVKVLPSDPLAKELGDELEGKTFSDQGFQVIVLDKNVDTVVTVSSSNATLESRVAVSRGGLEVNEVECTFTGLWTKKRSGATPS